MRVNCLACNHSFALNAQQLGQAVHEAASLEGATFVPVDAETWSAANAAQAELSQLRAQVRELMAELEVARAPETPAPGNAAEEGTGAGPQPAS